MPVPGAIPWPRPVARLVLMDMVDLAQIQRERLDEFALHVRHPAAPEATGFCLNCGEPLPAGQRWCDTDCRDDWEIRERESGVRNQMTPIAPHRHCEAEGRGNPEANMRRAAPVTSSDTRYPIPDA